MYCLELLYKLTDAQERAKFLGIQPKTYLGTDVLAVSYTHLTLPTILLV